MSRSDCVLDCAAKKGPVLPCSTWVFRFVALEVSNVDGKPGLESALPPSHHFVLFHLGCCSHFDRFDGLWRMCFGDCRDRCNRYLIISFPIATHAVLRPCRIMLPLHSRTKCRLNVVLSFARAQGRTSLGETLIWFYLRRQSRRQLGRCVRRL